MKDNEYMSKKYLQAYKSLCEDTKVSMSIQESV